MRGKLTKIGTDTIFDVPREISQTTDVNHKYVVKKGGGEGIVKIGLLGGTFNPIHTGHLTLAQESWHQLSLDKVVFIPSHIPPHKEIEGAVSAADRLNMVRLALEGDDRFEISTYELDKEDISYSIETIRHSRDVYGPEAEFYFLSGADCAENLSTWKDIDAILESVTFVIATRPEYEGKCLYEDRIKRITIPGVDVSSNMVRKRILDREPIDFIVPANVVQYIRNKGLYRD